MKFDICVGNPPYSKNFHLKIINTVINHLTEDGVASFIHPARWYEDPLAEIKKNSDKVKFKDIVSKIENVKMMDPLSVYKHFKIISNGDLMISYMKKNNTHKVELYDDTFKNGFDTILKYSLKHNLNNVIDENCIDGWRVLIKRVLAAKTENGRMDKYARIDCLKVVPNISVFYNGKTKDGLDWTETFNSGDKKKEKGTPMQKSIQFKSEEEANNFSTSCHTNFFMNCMYLFRFGIDAPLAYLPWMEDYSHPWTDEDYCKFFAKYGMSEECQKWMCRDVYDYRIKDFVDYEKFDDSKIEENQEEYS